MIRGWLVATVPAAAAAAESTSASASTARGLFFRFVDRERPATNLSPVQGRDGGLGIALAPHFDECKAPGASGIAIGDDLHIRNVATTLFEERTELGCIRIKREIADIHSCSHTLETPFAGLLPAPDG
jgi:hypothetical protein